MEKNYLIAIGIIAAVLICGGLAYTMLGDGQYHSITLAGSGTTLEVPDNMVVKTNDTNFGFLVLQNDNTLVISFNSANNVLSNLIGPVDIEKTIFGNDTDRNITVTDPSFAGYTLILK